LSGKWTSRLIAGAVAVVAIAGVSGWIVLDRESARPSHVVSRAGQAGSSSTVPTTTLPPTTTTLSSGAPLPIVPPPRRIVWAGDSLADSLASEIITEARTRGVEVLDRAVSGCGMVRGAPTDETFQPITIVSACDSAIPSLQQAIASLHPDVVTWLSSWETANRIVDGQQLLFATPQGDAQLLGLIDESVARLSANGARVVFLTLPPNTTGPNRPVVSPQDDAAALHLNALLRQYAAAHADRVSILDLAAIVCPSGPPCPPEVNGVTLRPVDGGHYAGDGPAYVAPRVLDQLLGPR
jgi:hypothetical protein